MAERPKVHQLPRGRHRLTREEVLSSQRGRMLAAMGTSVGEKGFAKTSVSDVIKGAGVSRETFYEHFSDKEDCFLAAIDTGVKAMLTTLGDALAAEPDAPPLERLDRTLRAYLDAMASEPHFSRAFLIEVYAAGDRAIERRNATQRTFVEAMAQTLGATRAADRFACEALVAAISQLVTARVAEGKAGELRTLRRPLVELVRRTGLVEAAEAAAAGRRSA